MNYKIPFGNLVVSESSKRHLDDVVRTNFVSGGPKVKALENAWGGLFGYKYNVAMSSGTSADIAACMTLYDLGAKRGDEIIVPALAFAAAGNSVIAAGFSPKFVDVKRETLNIDPEKIEEAMTSKTKAIMAVHTMGKPCEMDALSSIAKESGLKIIEDSCEAHGGKYKGKFIGKWGDVATFSFYVAHIISCGDGGIVSTDNLEIRDILDSVKHHGRKPGSLYFNHLRYGLNFRMNDLTASIGLPEIENFWNTFNKRKDNFYTLTERMKDLEEFAYFVTEGKDEIVSPHAFSLTLKDPKLDYKKFYAFLDEKGIQCKRNFGSMPTQHNAFKFLGNQLGEFPEAEYVGDNGLHFGVHQFLKESDLDYISESVHSYFESL